ncbi:unnamed protein product [Ectocarpus sp. 4 AP-2014]
MEANVTELWRIVESLQVELDLLRANSTPSIADSATDQLDSLRAEFDSMETDMNVLWLMVGSILVVLMQAGFAMLEAGSVSETHVKSILVKNLLDLAVAAVMWWWIGWGIAFGEETEDGGFKQFAGPGSFFSRGGGFIDESGNYGTTEGYAWALWLFQWSFSGTAVTIVSGAVGIRIAMPAYVMTAQVIVGFIYPVVVRWGWNSHGWASAWSSTRDDLLFGCGVIDFAGSGVVHTTGGMASLVMMILIGPRLGRFSGGISTKPTERSTLGAFMIWVGWYGFNGCSTLYITGSSHVAAKAMVCTTICATSAGLGVTSASLVLFQHVEPQDVVNGILSGLVAISASCAVVEVEGAFFIGLVSAVIYLGCSRFVDIVRIDDMVDAAPVHLANGVWGMIAAGLFASQEGYSASYYADRSEQCCGWLYGCGTAQILANFSFVLSILCWVGLMTFMAGFSLKYVGLLRISEVSERFGADAQHGYRRVELPDIVRKVLSQVEGLVAKAADERDPPSFASNSGGTSERKSPET